MGQLTKKAKNQNIEVSRVELGHAPIVKTVAERVSISVCLCAMVDVFAVI